MGNKLIYLLLVLFVGLLLWFYFFGSRDGHHHREPSFRIWTTMQSLKKYRKLVNEGKIDLENPSHDIYVLQERLQGIMPSRCICVVEDDKFYNDYSKHFGQCKNKELVTKYCTNGGFVIAEGSKKVRLNVPNPTGAKVLDPEKALSLSELYSDFSKNNEKYLKESRPLLW
jgi:hypothetical protein